MTLLTRCFFHFKFNASEVEKIQAKEHYEILIQNVSKQLFQQEVTVQVEFHDGSLKFWLGVAGAIYIAIGQYGSFRAGVSQIVEDAKILKKIVYNDLKKHGILEEQVVQQKRLIATPDKIRKLYLKIDRYESRSESIDDTQKEKEIKSIIKSVSLITYELEYEKDYELFLSSVKSTYKPRQFPIIERLIYRRKEDEIPTLLSPSTNIGLLVESEKYKSDSLAPSTAFSSYPVTKSDHHSTDLGFNSDFPGPFKGFNEYKKGKSLDNI